jgi:AcrR family transcriptional regulator
VTDPTAERIVDAALRQFELVGVSRSTMDDVARRAGVSRVTLYRRFAGRDALVDAVMQRELRRFLVELDAAIGVCDDVEGRVIEGFVFVMEAISGHRLLQSTLEREPETVLPLLTVQGSAFVDVARAHLAGRLAAGPGGGRSADDLQEIADVVVRLLLSYLLIPPTLVDFEDGESARAFARRFLLPLLDAA